MSKNTQSTKIVTVTPERAAAWLKRQESLVAQDPNMRQRHVKEDKVRMYARDMAADKWDVNGETIILAANGRVLDGQHRLLACVEAERSFRTHVVENVPHEAMKTIDTGVGRSMGDQLTIGGRIGGSRLAVALGVIWRWEQTDHKGFEWRARPTRLEMFDTLEKHPDLERFTSRAGRTDQLMSPGLAGALWYIFDKQDSTLAEAFFEAVISGANLQEKDPVFLLRERLLRERREAAIRRTNKTLTMDYTTELVFRAWDATRRGVKIGKLQVGPRGTESRLLTRKVEASRPKKVVSIGERKS